MGAKASSAGLCWVWPASIADPVNSTVDFRHEFDLESVPAKASLRVSASRDYILWLNGALIGFGQYHTWPDKPAYDEYDVAAALKRGKNMICVTGYHMGEVSSQHVPGPAGVVFSLHAGRARISSGAGTHWRISRAYAQGAAPRITPQLGFTFQYDAREADDWTSQDYKEQSDWAIAKGEDLKPEAGHPLAVARPIPRLEHKGRLKTRVVAQGRLKRSTQGKCVAETMKFDEFTSATPEEIFSASGQPEFPSSAGVSVKGPGAYLIVDTGREEAGLLSLDFEACAGTVVDIGYGEHLEDGRVRTFVGPRSFAARYVCREGRNSFVHYLTRWAGRYIQLSIPDVGAGFRVRYIGLEPTDYPLTTVSEFKCTSDLHQRIAAVSDWTLRLCMHEHYEDCPWREQSLYAMDMRNQALAGYYLYGNYDFARASLDLLRDGLNDDGFLELCAPARVPITIPSFTLAWVLAIADHLLYSGDLKAARDHFSTLKTVISAREFSVKDGLIPSPCGDRYWHFYEWANGLDGAVYIKDPAICRFDAPLNLMYCLAARSAAWMARKLDANDDAARFERIADRVAKAIPGHFWDPSAGLMLTYAAPEKPHYAEFTQALAVLAQVLPEAETERMRKALAEGRPNLVPATLSHCFYKFEALMTKPETYARTVFDTIAKQWGFMLDHGATTFWETIDGAKAFSNAGSLCHGWSGVPPYFYGAYILGVKPTQPGFKEFGFAPIAVADLRARGCIPTPAGVITVSVEGQEPQLLHPKGLSVRKG